MTSIYTALVISTTQSAVEYRSHSHTYSYSACSVYAVHSSIHTHTLIRWQYAIGRNLGLSISLFLLLSLAPLWYVVLETLVMLHIKSSRNVLGICTEQDSDLWFCCTDCVPFVKFSIMSSTLLEGCNGKSIEYSFNKDYSTTLWCFITNWQTE